MKTPIKIESIEITMLTSSVPFLLWKDGDYMGNTEADLIELFEAEPFHYATVLEGNYNFSAFNTYNYGAPIVLCGVHDENFDIAIVNFHRGGDARGNYGSPYFIEGYDNVTNLIAPQYELLITLDNGEQFYRQCENSEMHFPFDTFDIDLIDLEEFTMSQEIYEEINQKMEVA